MRFERCVARCLISTGIGCLVLASMASAQEQIWKVEGDSTHRGAGYALDVVADVNGDGVRDVATLFATEVRILSGIDGSYVYSVQAPNLTDSFGISIAGLGDVDGDGIGDFAVAAPTETNLLTNQGAVYVYSGAS